jgi:hypothetical protein
MGQHQKSKHALFTSNRLPEWSFPRPGFLICVLSGNLFHSFSEEMILSLQILRTAT